MTNDITSELAKLHELTGVEFSRQVERIAKRKEFHPLETDKDIFTTGGEQSDDYENLLQTARKAVEFGYRVYLLPNPTEIRTPDFILEKKRVFRIYDLKTVYGKSSISDSLIDSIGQCNRILINIFEINSQAVEVLIFKGGKRISVMRHMTIGEAFFHMFKKAYER